MNVLLGYKHEQLYRMLSLIGVMIVFVSCGCEDHESIELKPVADDVTGCVVAVLAPSDLSEDRDVVLQLGRGEAKTIYQSFYNARNNRLGNQASAGWSPRATFVFRSSSGDTITLQSNETFSLWCVNNNIGDELIFPADNRERLLSSYNRQTVK